MRAAHRRESLEVGSARGRVRHGRADLRDAARRPVAIGRVGLRREVGEAAAGEPELIFGVGEGADVDVCAIEDGREACAPACRS